VSQSTSADRVSGSSYLRGQIYRELASVVGAPHISDDPALLQAHAHDWSWMSKYLLYKNLALPAADIAVSPATTEEVREIVRIASTFKVPLVPRGGGTGTQGGTLALYGGISVDLSRMNRILDIDETSLVVRTQVGIDGPTLDKSLNPLGLTLAHYPGAYEMGASVGGFIAARGSGVVSTKYGKAENQVMQVQVVVPPGRVIETLPVPSHAAGSDLLQTFVGSEGTLGIMTEAVMRLDPLPETRVFLSFRFSDIFAGMEAARLIITKRLRPSVIRLYDEGDAKKLSEWVGTTFVGTLMVVMCDGAQALTDYESTAITQLCEQAGGESLGPNAGQVWWDGKYEPYKKGKLPQPPLLYGTTDTVARFRDIPRIYRARKEAVEQEFKAYHARYNCHLSHFYDWGSMLYDRFYIDQPPDNPADALALHDRLWDVCTAVGLKHGGVVNEHHGVGLKLGRFMHKQYGPDGWALVQALKDAWDPDGIMNPGKLGYGPPKNARW
jgi:alkyldihydroxyacetonephosphate synthase